MTVYGPSRPCLKNSRRQCRRKRTNPNRRELPNSALLEAYDIQASMSRIGNPYDNAKAESFMKTLKCEQVDGTSYRDADQARRSIGAFIEDVYNRKRLHSALGYRPPAEFEATSSPPMAAVPRSQVSLN